jgi:hypothetical protein
MALSHGGTLAVDTQFDRNHLQMLSDAEEIVLELDSAPQDLQQVVLWVVAVGPNLYVRSVNGQHGHWYQKLLTESQASIRAEDQILPVRAVPVSDQNTWTQVSCEYLRKYAQYPQDAAWLVTPEIVATTMRLEPVNTRSAVPASGAPH